MKIGTMLYHESRYWKTDGLTGDETPGWNARYLPYVVTRVTDKTIFATGAGADMQTSHVQFPRHPKRREGHARPYTFEADGRQYHSRFHEYFYTEVPTKQHEIKRSAMLPKVARALSTLGLPQMPYTPEVVKRAYKKLAREKHPDVGGSHEEFVKLRDARDVALRGY